MTKLGTVSSLFFEETLIITLTKDWINQFTKIPRFDVSIDKKGRLCIISEEPIKND